MAQTPRTGSAAYATNADFLIRYDARTIGDLLSDQDRRLTSSEVTASTVLTALLKQASGDVEAAAVAGQRYSPDDLNALTGNAQQFLVGLVCDLCMWRVINRRPGIMPMPPQCEAAYKMLELLRGGDRIFPTDEASNAGVDIHREMTECLVTDSAQRYFGNYCDSCGCR